MNDLLLIVKPGLTEKMDRALITPEDAKQVIVYCEETGVKLQDDDTGDYIGHRRIGALTYWVRYRFDGGTYTLLSIYAHRAVLTQSLENKPEQEKPTRMTCLKCNQRLIEKKVTFYYLDFPFSTPLPSCPSCGQVYLSDEFVRGKLSEVEKTLEDK